MKIPVFNSKAKEEITLDPEIFGIESSSQLVAQAVRVYLSNQRKAYAKAKTRGEVVGSSAKIWKQKGTGHARHGNRKAPIFVGGGVTFGPTGKENYKRRLSQKMAQKAIFSTLSDKTREKKLLALKDLNFQKTKDASVLIKQIKKDLGVKGKIGILLAKNEEAKRFLSNIKDVSILSTESLNPYFILNIDFLFVTDKALEELKKINLGKEGKNVH